MRTRKVYIISHNGHIDFVFSSKRKAENHAKTLYAGAKVDWLGNTGRIATLDGESRGWITEKRVL